MTSFRHFALIGHPLGHSFSKALFDKAFDGRHDYRLLDIKSIDCLRKVVSENDLSGFNVTIPYKVEIMPLLDRLTNEAQEVGAVNCVRVETDGTLTGHNTDSEAFQKTLDHSQLAGATALILGTGGAAKAVAAAFGHLGIKYLFVSRNAGSKSIGQSSDNIISYEKAYKTVRRQQEAVSIIVNATPVGMAPLSGETPWMHPELLSEKTIVYDLTYNPSPTRFLSEAEKAGAQVKDGLEMLRLQAYLSWQFWEI